MFKLLDRLFGNRGKAVRAAPVPTRTPANPTDRTTHETAAEAAVRQASVRPRLDRTASPEVLCGLTPGMTTDEIRDQLAVLYKRHNRAASSLEADLREEAELMLDAIVRCRETFLGMPTADSDGTPRPG